MLNNIPIVKPINIPEYEYKQSKYDMVPKLPFRSIIVASSTGGKTVLIQNWLLNIYRGSIERVYIFSPSIHADPAFCEVKKYQREVMKVDDTKEDLYFEGFNPADLQKILDTQKRVVEFQKKNKEKKLFSICICIDDHSDDPKFIRYSSMLHGLFTRGRHQAVSCILSLQKYSSTAPIIRLNASSLYIFKLKNMTEVNSFLDENSAVVDKKTLYEMYQQAINDAPYSFFYINMNSKDTNKMFYIRFEKAFMIDDDN